MEEIRHRAATTPTLRAVTTERSLLGEGPTWHADRGVLTWVDIYGRRINELDPASGATRSWPMPDRVTAAIPRVQGGMVVALARSIALFEPETGRLEEVARLDADDEHRFNEAKCDRHGRLWIGSMNEATLRPTGCLYRFDGRGLHVAERGIAISNGIAWSPDERHFYFTDTRERRLRVYDYEATAGEISNARVLAEVDGDAAFPDGATTDADGFLWNAQWDGARLVRYATDGRVDRIVAMPVSRPTSLCFGGSDLVTLFVTTACCDLSQARLRLEPEAGCVFALETGVRGTAASSFAW